MKKDTNISEISKDGNQDDEFIVKLDFYYSDVTYEGFLILNRREVIELLEAMNGERELYTPNMPGDWCEEFDISLLKDAFTIHSSGKEDIAAMRSVFGDSVGNTELYDQIVEGEDEEYDFAIDEEKAREFLETENEDLLLGTSITEAAAEILSSYDGDCDPINLPNVRELSDESASALAKLEGRAIELQGLFNFSPVAAKAFTERGDLPGFKELRGYSNETLQEIVKIDNSNFFLQCVGCLTADACKIITSRTNDTNLTLLDINEFEEDSAQELAKFKGDELTLAGCFELNPKAAMSLANFKGAYLTLEIQELSKESAQALLAYRGELSIRELWTLPEDVAGALSSFKGSALEITGDLPEEAVRALNQYNGNLSLGWGEYELTPNTAKELSKFDGASLTLKLDFIPTESIAEILNYLNGTRIVVELGRSHLSGELAEVISEFDGDLSFNFLYELEYEAAIALSKHKRNINFGYIGQIGYEVRQALANHQGKIGGMAPAEWVASLDEE